MNTKSFHFPLRRAPALFFALTVAGTAGAAPDLPHPPSNNPALPQPALPAFKGKPAGERFQLPPAPVDTIAPAGTTKRVERIRFKDNQVIDGAVLAAIAQPYEGRELDPATIEELRQKITRRYIDAGYVNSGALLGPDSYADGTLTFTIVEGRLSAMRLKGLGNLQESYVVSRLVPDEEAPLNTDALRERFQMLLGDPLFIRAQARVIPDVTLGRAVLDIEFERAVPYQLSVFANNGRSASVGENVMGVTGSLRNLTGWGDQLELMVQNGAKSDWLNRQGGRQNLLWKMPLGGQGTELILQLDEGRSSVQEEPAAGLDIQSRLTTGELGLAQRIFENAAQRLTFGLGYNERTNRSLLLGQPFSFIPGEIDGKTRIKGWRFWQEYSHRWENQALVLRSTFLDNRTNLQPMAAAPSGKNAIWLGQGHYAWRHADSGIQVSAKGTVQQTAQRLSPLDRLAIGGAQSVRGFRENQLIRDEAHIVNLDADYPLWRSATDVPLLSAGLFTDAASGQNRDERSAHLSSAGVTLKAHHLGWRFDLAYAFNRRYAEGVVRRNDTLQDKGIHFQLSYDVFGK